MSNRDILKEPFWRLALRFGVIFITVIIIIQLIWELFSSGNLQAIPESFQNGKWIYHVISKIFLGIVYGTTMAFFMKRKAKK